METVDDFFKNYDLNLEVSSPSDKFVSDLNVPLIKNSEFLPQDSSNKIPFNVSYAVNNAIELKGVYLSLRHFYKRSDLKSLQRVFLSVPFPIESECKDLLSPFIERFDNLIIFGFERGTFYRGTNYFVQNNSSLHNLNHPFFRKNAEVLGVLSPFSFLTSSKSNFSFQKIYESVRDKNTIHFIKKENKKALLEGKSEMFYDYEEYLNFCVKRLKISKEKIRRQILGCKFWPSNSFLAFPSSFFQLKEKDWKIWSIWSRIYFIDNITSTLFPYIIKKSLPVTSLNFRSNNFLSTFTETLPLKRYLLNENSK